MSTPSTVAATPCSSSAAPVLPRQASVLSPGSLFGTPLEGKVVTAVELESGTVEHLVRAYVAQRTPDRTNLMVKNNHGGDSHCDSDCSDSEDECESDSCELLEIGTDAGGSAAGAKISRARMILGLGLFTFDLAAAERGTCRSSADSERCTMYLLNEALGAPVGSSCGAVRLERSLLIAEGADRADEIQHLVHTLVTRAESAKPNTFKMFNWNAEHGYWRYQATVPARALDTIALPDGVKENVLDDAVSFLGAETRKFYYRHGIPYRRSYLFHGPPGTGKTSVVQAMAGYLKRSLCVLQPSHPKLTDEGLMKAVQDLPSNALVVLEDVDAIFDDTRGNKAARGSGRGGTNAHHCVSFSGLLNALDGAGSSKSTLFVLTTNHRERLDPALIRPGRVDVHAHFAHAGKPQIETMFRSFYPAESAAPHADSFAMALVERFGDSGGISCAALQALFVAMRRESSAEVAQRAVERMEQLMESRGDLDSAATAKEHRSKDKTKEEPKKKKKTQSGGTSDDEEEPDSPSGDEDGDDCEDHDDASACKGGKKTRKPTEGRRDVHVHIH